ncbi:MAG: toll/interleukin-1 receptor domain-containing protein [Hydrogenophaga sp.]|nr:toll/interleukin-1 receptor domain-containing protein [Hydrogenophaga sp.]
MALIFVSHAAADKEIAKRFQDDIKSDFLGMCEVFVSSNLDSLNAGYDWNNIIRQNLENCSILVGLLSPLALQRPWIYVEFGAGWIRKIPTIPVCHSGAERGQLPAPISSFQALNLWEAEHLEYLYQAISNAVGCQKPAINFGERAATYLETTDRVRLKRLVFDWISQLFEWNPEFKLQLKGGNQEIEIMVPANLDQPFMQFVNEVNERRYLIVQRAGMAMGTRVGPQASIFKVAPGEEVDALMAHLDP